MTRSSPKYIFCCAIAHSCRGVAVCFMLSWKHGELTAPSMTYVNRLILFPVFVVYDKARNDVKHFLKANYKCIYVLFTHTQVLLTHLHMVLFLFVTTALNENRTHVCFFVTVKSHVELSYDRGEVFPSCSVSCPLFNFGQIFLF
jgi:hypothetical protein